jgi:adenylate cyclase
MGNTAALASVDNAPVHAIGREPPAESVPQQAPRPAAVAFADIVGYTTLMSVDPARTHAHWMDLLNGVLRPLARARGCRVAKSTGDGIAADFPDAAGAFTWAQAVHAHIAAIDTMDRPPIVFRIAIDQGEITATAEDIYGTCVNNAARLQEHAPPGGIVVTDRVRDSLPAPPPMEDLGELVLRNIEGSVRAFALAPACVPRVPMRTPLLGIPAVAVMPFENLSGDLGELYFAEGLIEDIVISLGALREISVVARGATLGWTGGRIDPRVVGRVLGVRYVLTGSVRRGGGGLRMSAALRECEAGDLIWSERYDIAAAELFSAQDEIVERAVNGIAPSIRAAELRRALRKRANDISAYDLTLRGMHGLDGLRRDAFLPAGESLSRAIDIDPAYAMPVAWSAQWHSLAVGQGWSAAPERDAMLVGEMAARAIQLDPANALGWAMSGHHRAYHQRDPQSALEFFDRAVAACPSHALSWTLRSGSLSYLGRGPEALAAARRGHALSPRGPDRSYYECFLGLAYLAAGEHATAAHWMGIVLAESPAFTSAHRILVACQDALGQPEAAAKTLRQMLEHEQDFSLARYADERCPYVDSGLRAQMLGALQRAGAPA